MSDQKPVFLPVLGQNLAYIVVGIVIKDNNVLMMQEAKPECRGTWYLPAGRLEKNETLIEGVQREVLEETGLSFQPHELVLVESMSKSWHRFTFIGDASGNLKTDADQESLSAAWVPLPQVYEAASKRPNKASKQSSSQDFYLRCPDIVAHIHQAEAYLKAQQVTNVTELMQRSQQPALQLLLPLPRGHAKFSVELFCCVRCENTICILLQTNGSVPCFTMHTSFQQQVKQLLQESFPDESEYLLKLHGHKFGICGLEHNGKEADGLFLSLYLQPVVEVAAVPALRPEVSHSLRWVSTETVPHLTKICWILNRGQLQEETWPCLV